MTTKEELQHAELITETEACPCGSGRTFAACHGNPEQDSDDSAEASHRSKKAQRTKNQHFVPQMLLRRFAVPNTRERAVAAFNLETNKTVPIASISGQCARSFYYGKDGTIERSLARVEGAAALAIDSVIKSQVPAEPETKEWADIITFLAVQRGRTPGSVNASNQRLAAMMDQARKFARSVGDEDAINSIAHLMVPSQPVLDNLQVTTALAPLMCDLEDVLLVNETAFGFAISDIGIITHNEWTTGVRGMGTDGLACRGLMLLLPLSPRHLLMKYDASVYSAEGALDRSIRIRDESEVRSLNHISLAFAERSIYFDGDASTREGLEKLAKNGIRAPLSSLVRAERFTDETGFREVIHVYSDRPQMTLDLKWLLIDPSLAALPTHARAQQYRPAAMAAARAIRGEQDPPDPTPTGTVFRRVRDD